MMGSKKISVVIPIYNESKIIKELSDKLKEVAGKSVFEFEWIFVNDGSSDNSLEILINLSKDDTRIKIIDLSRNFGHQQAISAGMDFADADAVILMDADLEDRPEDLPQLISKWQEGFDVVYAIRKSRQVSYFRKICFSAFHFFNKLLSEVPMEPTGIFGLMDRRVVDEIKRLEEKNRYIPGLRSWVGFRQASIILERGKRYDLRPRVTFSKLVSLAMNSYFAFSKRPMRIAAFLGFFLSFVSFAGLLFVIAFQMIMKFKVSGWASLAALILFISSMQFVCIGIMGEYIGRIFDEAKERPLYIVRDTYNLERQR
jgi:dolichol-phosphate mannosyltransferase